TDVHVHRAAQGGPRRHRQGPRPSLGSAAREVQDLSDARLQSAGRLAGERDGGAPQAGRRPDRARHARDELSGDALSVAPISAAADGSGFGRTAYMLAYTLIAGDYPVLEKNVEDPRDAGAAAGAELAARVAALQRRVEILGVVGRDCFAPRLTVALRDGRRVTG